MKKEEYYLRLEKAIEFIEENLHKKFLLSDVSKNAFNSLSHFHRIFYFMTGVTIKEYIRHRRLSNAAMQLIATKKSVLDIAFEAQFESPESFNKAFKKLFSLSPSKFRNLKPEFQIISKMTLRQIEKLNQPENISINFIYFPQQIILGVKTRTTLEGGQQARDIPLFFEKVMRTHLLKDIISNSLDKQKIWGIYSDMSEDEAFNYTVGMLVDKISVINNEKYAQHVLPESEYARFTVQGDPNQLENAWRYIYGMWMPNSGYSRKKGLDFEIYYSDKTDIYIPIGA